MFKPLDRKTIGMKFDHIDHKLMTLLQEDDAVFTETLHKIGKAVNEYYS